MAHPHEEHKTTHLKRVGRMLKGYKRAHGGAVHADEAQDRKLVRKMLKAHDAKMHGEHPKKRADKFARGGRAKGGKTHINVNVMPQNPMQPQRIPVPVPAQSPPIPPGAGAMPPGLAVPPGGAPPSLARPPMPGMMPPGMPMRKRGGRIADGPAWAEGNRNGTKVQHLPGKDLSDNLKKPYPITRASGGRAEFGEKIKTAAMVRRSSGNSEGGRDAKSDFGEKMKPPMELMHGSAGGLGRLEKTTKERKAYP